MFDVPLLTEEALTENRHESQRGREHDKLFPHESRVAELGEKIPASAPSGHRTSRPTGNGADRRRRRRPARPLQEGALQGSRRNPPMLLI